MSNEEYQGQVEALSEEVVAARKVLLLFVNGKPEALDEYDTFLCDYGLWPGVDAPDDQTGEI